MMRNYKIFLYVILILCSLALISNISYASYSRQDQAPKRLEVYHEEVETGKYKVYARNNNYAPYQIKLSFQQLKNMNANVKLPYYDVIDARTEKQELFTITAEQGKSFSLKYNYEYVLGDPKATAPDGTAYLFPYRHGEKHKVTQGYRGQYSHSGKLALDFEMEKGTPITAARSGRVVRVKEDSNTGGASKRYIKEANYITIYHDDETFAEYAHLQHRGSRVAVGDRVSAGQVIGYSGNTGWSRGPHLHFEVFKPTRMDQETIATEFLNHEQQRVEAQSGKYYYSFHPGHSDYEVELGTELTDADYEDYKKSTAETNQLELVTERVDDTIILFIENGYDREVEVEIDFKRSKNVKTSKTVPFSTTVPATTETYAFLLRPNNPDKAWDYSIQYNYRR